jgi:hypothetical protein
VKKILMLGMCCFAATLQAESTRSHIKNRTAQAEKDLAGLKKSSEFYGNPTTRTAILDNNVYLSGEFLYWTAYEDGLYYADKINQQDQSNPTIHKIIEPTYPWKPAFSLGLGTYLKYDQWNLEANWTYFHTRTINKVKALSPSAGSLLQTNLIPVAAEQQLSVYNDLTSDWELNFNTIDFDLSRSYYLSSRCAITPGGGVKAAWINQDMHYHGSSDPSGGNSAQAVNAIVENNFMGVGPKVFGELSWYFVRSFKIMGRLGGSLLYGKFKTKRMDTTLSVTNTFDLGLLDDTMKIRPMAQALLGFAWESPLGRNKQYFLEFAITYEAQIWFRQLAARRLLALSIDQRFVTAIGDLGINGFGFKAQLGF